MMKKVFLDMYAGTITPNDLWILNMVKGTVTIGAGCDYVMSIQFLGDLPIVGNASCEY